MVHVTLIVCLKSISVILTAIIWLWIMTRILLTVFIWQKYGIRAWRAWLPCHSALAPLPQPNFCSVFYSTQCHISETQMAGCHVTSIKCPRYCLCERNAEDAWSNTCSIYTKGWDWPQCQSGSDSGKWHAHTPDARILEAFELSALK